MREIKFRAWNTEKQMMSGKEFAITSKGGYLLPTYSEFIKQMPCELIDSPYSGIKEKPGRRGVVLSETRDGKSWRVRWDGTKDVGFVYKKKDIKLLKDNELKIWSRINTSRFIVMQYTGLLDKNGKKIFEGDIVKVGKGCPLNGPYHQVKEGDILVVKFLESGFTLMLPECIESDVPNLQSNKDNYQFWNSHRQLEVIGNVWENPELLK